jgi:hypothetical protein
MKIETKLNIKDRCYFLMCDAVREAVIERIETSNLQGQTDVIYTIEENPAGSQYTKRLLEHEVYETIHDLLDAL